MASCSVRRTVANEHRVLSAAGLGLSSARLEAHGEGTRNRLCPPRSVEVFTLIWSPLSVGTRRVPGEAMVSNLGG